MIKHFPKSCSYCTCRTSTQTTWLSPEHCGLPCREPRRWWEAGPLVFGYREAYTGSPVGTPCHIASCLLYPQASRTLKEHHKQKPFVQTCFNTSSRKQGSKLKKPAQDDSWKNEHSKPVLALSKLGKPKQGASTFYTSSWEPLDRLIRYTVVLLVNKP